MLATLTLQKIVQDESDIEDLVDQLESMGYHVDVETYDEDEAPDYNEALEEDFRLHGLVNAQD